MLDLGSGGGIDVLISARRVGASGKAIGLDMTDEMLELARANAAEAGVENVEFLKGHIEDVPLPDDSVDVMISNCVINLSADKPAVFREAARVLKPGGRFAVTDVIAEPTWTRRPASDMQQWTGCIAGALTEDRVPGRRSRQRASRTSRSRETHRVHEHAGSAIVRARTRCHPMRPLPASSGWRVSAETARKGRRPRWRSTRRGRSRARQKMRIGDGDVDQRARRPTSATRCLPAARGAAHSQAARR